MLLELILAALVSIAPVSSLTGTAMAEFLAERAAVHGANARTVVGVARCETGGTFNPYVVGRAGERGVGQWLPGRGNHWDMTPGWREHGLDIVAMYRANHDEAPYWDADMLAWSIARGLGPSGWVTCYRRAIS